MSKINFWEIFKKAFNLSWKNKKLWWLGLIIGSGSSLNLNFPLPSPKEESKPSVSLDKIQSFATDHFSLLATLAFILFILIILFGLFKILAYSGLIKELMSSENKEKFIFWSAIKEGRQYFWRVFEIKLIFILSSLALLLILALPVIFLFSLKSFVLGSIIAILALSILIPAFVAFFFIEKFGTFYVITSNLTLSLALEQGYKIMLKNIWPSIVMSLLFIPLNILIGTATLISIFVASLPFVLIGFIFYKLFAPLGAWLIGILGALSLAICLLILRSFLGVFYNTLWFLFFKEIATAKKEEIEIKKEELIIAKEIQPEKI